MENDEYMKMLAKHLYSPSVTEMTIAVGCLTWGYERILDLLIHIGTDAQVVEAATAATMMQFKRRMPTVEVDTDTMRMLTRSHQIASWDRAKELKQEMLLLWKEAHQQ